jgi:hypothetical protein
MALIYGSAPDMSWTSTTNTSGGISAGGAVPWIQLVGSLFAAQGARTQAKMNTQNLRFQGDIASLNAKNRQALMTINADLSQQSTLLGAAYAEALAKIQSDQVKYVGEVNAKISEIGAQSELEAGQKQVASMTLQAGQLKSRQRAAMAANGIDLGEGSAAEILASTDIMKEIDKGQIEQNAIRAAWGHRTQGVAQQIDANTQATNIEISGMQQASQIRTQGARDLYSIQTQGSREAWEFRSAANANYAASNSISPDRAFTSSFITGAQGVADSWYRWSTIK